MIIYESTKTGFTADVDSNLIDEKLAQAILTKMGHNTGRGELESWQNSLRVMAGVLRDPAIPDDAGIALEYNIPYTQKRIDMIVSGADGNAVQSAVVIELKQWESVTRVLGKDAIVRTYLSGADREVTHPSYQVWSYVRTMHDFCAEVQERPIYLHPCTFLHNYLLQTDDPLTDTIYLDCLREAPVFTKHDVNKLREFIARYIRKGDRGEAIVEIDQGRLRPSKSLQDEIATMIRGNSAFTMIDDQKVVYEDVLQQTRNLKPGQGKRVIIVRGGPGTGKSVLAVNLLAQLTKDGLTAAYVSKNGAPRQVYAIRLKGTAKKKSVDAMFRGSGCFVDAPDGAFDTLLADEAHRLNEKSGLFANQGVNQVKEIIHAARTAVFFLDEDQQVTLKDIGSVDEISKWAKEEGAPAPAELELVSQFRCNGSDGYLQWLDDLLDIRSWPGIRPPSSEEYDFRVFDDPNELRRAIEEKNRINNRARLVAGYCWNWVTEGKDDPSVHDIVIPEYHFEMSWNLGSYSDAWAINPDSVGQAGCIHTCQGLEFDYVGVIIGPDLFYKDGKACTDWKKRAKTDSSLKGLKSKYPDPTAAQTVADRIIRNTYRVLMSRGQKGCFVYCTDHKLAISIKKQLCND